MGRFINFVPDQKNFNLAPKFLQSQNFLILALKNIYAEIYKIWIATHFSSISHSYYLGEKSNNHKKLFILPKIKAIANAKLKIHNQKFFSIPIKLEFSKKVQIAENVNETL